MEHNSPQANDGAQAVAREALLEMQRYLADEIAPMMAVDAAKVLLRMPPKYGASVIRLWMEAELTAPDRAVTVASYLYHAVKKFYLFSEFKFIDSTLMNRYLSELSRIVIQLCPEQERPELRLKLSRIGEAQATLSAPVKVLHREMGTEIQEQKLKEALERQKREPKDSAGDQRDPAVISPRLAMLFDQLEELAGSDRPDQAERQPELIAPMLTKAAIEARNAAQFDQTLDRLRAKGVDPKFDWMFRLLGQRLPGWILDPDRLPPGVEAKPGPTLQAMHRIVSLAGSGEEGIERFSEMVYTAIEQFNEGHLAQAVAIFDVAQRLIEEKKIDAGLAKIVQTRAQECVSLKSLRRFATTTPKHGLLRKVLRFFPSFSPESLLQRLDGEPKRDVRKLILSLVEVHGQPCRPQVMERLSGYLTGDLPDDRGFYSRNIVFLLRRIPRGPKDDQQQELRLLSEFSEPGQPFMVAKEAVISLAQLTIPQAKRVLLDRLSRFEQESLTGSSTYDPEEMLEMLDRTCAALAKMNTTDTIRGVVEHGFRKESVLGDTTRRLEHLAACNLGGNHAELERLLQSLGEMLPGKVLGIVFGRRIRHVSHLVRALSGTPESSVREQLREIVERFPGQEFAEQAAKALTRMQSGPAPEAANPEGLTGDLELFGLPTLLQSLADSEQTGRLVISERNGRDRAVLVYTGGEISRCECGRLRGLDAACQLFERPQPGTFRFENTPPGSQGKNEGESLAAISTLLEAMRRHDEFQEDRALVPDGAMFMPTKSPPTPFEHEADQEFMRAVWREASRGTAPESCEGALAGDAYRIRKLYVHWLETGALRRRPVA